MEPKEIVQAYYDEFFSGPARHSNVRRLLTDDFVFRDPLMSADSADEYVEKLRAYGDTMDLRVEVRSIIGDGSRVAALVDLQGPAPVTYAQWFTFDGDRIARLEVIYDPRAFLQADR